MLTVKAVDDYDRWMAENPNGQDESSEEITLRMQQAFPELSRIRGVLHDTRGMGVMHWWLKVWGMNVDPSFGFCYYADGGEYIEYEEVKP